MSKQDEFPKSQGADNTKEGIMARKARLLQEQREREDCQRFLKNLTQ